MPARTDGREIDAAFLRGAGEGLRGRIEAALAGDEFYGLGPRLTAKVGQALLSRNPFYRFERRVYAALAEAASEDGDRRQRRERDQAQELEKIIQETRLDTVFQPVVDCPMP